MLYKLVNHLIEDKGYSHQRVGYIFAKAVSEMDSRRYLSRLEDPVYRAEKEGVPAQELHRAEQHIRARFVRSLAFKILHDYCGEGSKAPSIDTASLVSRVEQRLQPKYRRNSVEETLYEGLSAAAGNGTGYLTKVGKNVAEYLADYIKGLDSQEQANYEKGKRFRKRTKENKERKAAKRPNPIINHDEIYEILRKAFTSE